MTRVLIADSDAAELAHVERVLTQEAPGEYAVTGVADYESALHAIRTSPPDAAIVALRLATRSALDLIDEIDDAGAPPIVVLLGEGDSIDGAALRARGHDCVEKRHVARGLLGPAIRRAIDYRRALERAWRSEERARVAFENAREGFALTDGDGHIVFVGESITRMLGYSPDEMLSHHFRDFVLDDDMPQALAAFADALDHPGQTVQCELRARRKDGVLRTFEVIVVNRLRQPAVAAVVTNFRDVTARSTAAEALRLSEQQFRAVFENTLDAMVIADDTSRYVAANAAAVDLFGSPLAELLSRSGADYSPPGIDHAAEWRRFLAAGRTSGEYRLRRADGSFREVEFTAVANFMPGRHLAVLRDVTDRKRAEVELRRAQAELVASQARLATIFDSSPAAMCVADVTTGKILQGNRSLEELTGRSGANLIGRTTLEVGLWPDAETRRQILGRAREGETVRNVENYVRRADETERRVLMSFERLTQSGEGEQLLGILTDVTELRDLEEQVRQAQKIEAIGQLAGGIAHDFNNFLSVIIGFAELLLARPDVPPDMAGDVREILKAGRSAADLTQQLLAFGRRAMVEPRVIDLNRTIQQMEQLLRRLLGEQVTLTTRLAPDLRMVFADAAQCEQIILNLAINARDAMPRGGRIAIETANVTLDAAFVAHHTGAAAGGHVLLSVSDNGVGMTENVKARLFEPFFTTKERGKGTGLGLAVVYGAVKQSGGSIWVDTAPGRGTTFSVYLPARDGAAAPAVEPARAVSLYGSETILLVEDQDDVRRMTRQMLTRHGYVVLEASSARQALRILSTSAETIKLLLTDVVMPQVSGRELARLCHRHFPHIRVLYMSGYAADGMLRHGALEDGMAFVQKPFTNDQMLRRVRSVLDAGTAPLV